MKDSFRFLAMLFCLFLAFSLSSACSGDADDDDASESGSGDDDTTGDDDVTGDDDTQSGSQLPAGGFVGVDNGDGTITDQTTGLMWQKEMKSWYLDVSLSDAGPYCDELELAGYDDWYLPSVEEFRSLIIGCESTMIGGACAAGSACASSDECLGECSGCELMAGPASGGYYLDDLFDFARNYATCWTTTVAPYSSDIRFVVDFRMGSVGEAYEGGNFNVRCVRAP